MRGSKQTLLLGEHEVPKLLSGRKPKRKRNKLKKLTLLIAAAALALAACGGGEVKADEAPTENTREIKEASSGGMERAFEEEEAVEEAPAEEGVGEAPAEEAPAEEAPE